MQVLFRVYLSFELVADSPKSASGMPLLTDVIDARVPPAARQDFENGRAALKAKNYKEGVALLEKATLGYSNFYEAQLLLGIAFMDLKEWDKGRTRFAARHRDQTAKRHDQDLFGRGLLATETQYGRGTNAARRIEAGPEVVARPLHVGTSLLGHG